MLNQLVTYARQNLSDSEPGFTTRTVRWLVEISADGQLINSIPLGDDKKGEQISRCPEMHNMNAGGRAHFLVETLQTIILLCKPNEEPKKIAGSQEKQLFFKEMVRLASVEVSSLESLKKFLDSDQLDLLRDQLSQEKAKPTDWLRWRIAGADPLQEPTVLDWWRSWRCRSPRDDLFFEWQETAANIDTTKDHRAFECGRSWNWRCHGWI
jgi:CRISPR-associated protein Csd1